jgi:LemA protein
MPAVAIVLVLAALFPMVFVLAQYNGLVNLRNYIQNAWSNIDTELKRRHELIPNLVATVKGYAKHEQDVLQEVTRLRDQCVSANSEASSQGPVEKQLVSALQRLLVLVEDYPDLKADSNFLQLQQELVNTEDRIQAARRFYNGNVRDYRNKCEMFPSSIVASMFGFKEFEYFDVDPSVGHVPNVNLAND